MQITAFSRLCYLLLLQTSGYDLVEVRGLAPLYRRPATKASTRVSFTLKFNFFGLLKAGFVRS